MTTSVSTQTQLSERGHRGLQRSSQTSHHVDTQHTSSLRASKRRAPPTVPMSTPHGQAEPAQNAGVLMDQLDAEHVAPSPVPFYVFGRRPGETPDLPRTVRRPLPKPRPLVALGYPDSPMSKPRTLQRHAVTDHRRGDPRPVGGCERRTCASHISC